VSETFRSNELRARALGLSWTGHIPIQNGSFCIEIAEIIPENSGNSREFISNQSLAYARKMVIPNKILANSLNDNHLY
jgi:hypothetical protein